MPSQEDLDLLKAVSALHAAPQAPTAPPTPTVALSTVGTTAPPSRAAVAEYAAAEKEKEAGPQFGGIGWRPSAFKTSHIDTQLEQAKKERAAEESPIAASHDIRASITREAAVSMAQEFGKRGAEVKVPLTVDRFDNPAINVAGFRDDVTSYYAQKEAERRGFRSAFDAPFAVRQEIERVGADEADREVERQLNVHRNATFVDLDPQKTSRQIAKLPPGVREAAAILAPQPSITLQPTGRRFEVERPGAAGIPGRLLNAYPAVESALGTSAREAAKESATTRESLARLGGVLAGTEKGEAAEHYVSAIRENRSFAEEMGEQGRLLAKAEGGDPDTGQRIGMVFGFVSGDVAGPDVLTMGLAAGGLGARLLTRNAAEVAAKAGERALHAPTLASAERILKAEGPHAEALNELLQMEYAREHAVPASVVGWQKRIADDAVKAEAAVQAARDKVVGAVDNATRVQAESERLDAEAFAALKKMEAADAKAQATTAAAASWRKEGEGALLGQVNAHEKAMETAERELREVAMQHALLEKAHGPALDDIDAAEAAAREYAEKLERARETFNAEKAGRSDAMAGLVKKLRELEAEERALAEAREGMLERMRIGGESAGQRTAFARNLERANEIRGAKSEVVRQFNAARRALPESYTSAEAAVKEYAGRLNKARQDLAAALERAGDAGKKFQELGARRAMAEAAIKKGRGYFATLGIEGGKGLRATAGVVAREVQQAMAEAKAAREAYRQALGAAKGADFDKAVSEVEAAHEAFVAREFSAAAKARRASGWKPILERLIGEIRTGREALKSLPKVGAKFEDPLIGGTKEIAKGGGPQDRMIDVAALRESLYRKWGQPAVEHVVAEGGPSGTLLGRYIHGEGERLMPEAHVAVLHRDLPDLLVKAAEVTHPETRAIQTIKAIETASRDPALKPKSIGQRVIYEARAVAQSFDYTRARIGDVAKDLGDIDRAFRNLSAQVDDEYFGAIRRTKVEDIHPDTVALVEKYWGMKLDDPAFLRVAPFVQLMDTNHPLPTLLRSHGLRTMMNAGPELPWAMAKRQLMGDPRAAAFIEENVRWGQEAVAAEAAKQTPPLHPTSDKLPDDKASGPMEALARMWLPSGRGVPGRTSMRFYREAYRDILPSSGTYSEFAARMRKLTFATLAETEPLAHADRALGFGARGAAHAMLYDIADRMTAKLMGFRVTAADVADVNKILGNDWSRIENFEKAKRIANQLGLPVTESSVRTMSAAGPKQREAIRLIVTGAADDSGGVYFQTAQTLRSFNENMPAVVKELDAHNAMVKGSVAGEIMRGLAVPVGWWRTSVVTGLIVPNPKYWLNNAVGDFSQVWMEQGLTVATAQSLQNLPVNIPFFGRLFQDWTAELARRAGKPTLGTAWNALFNPHIDELFNPATNARMVSRTGEVMFTRTVAQDAVEDGIMDTFAREDIVEAFTRAAPQWYTRWFRDWQDSISHFANFVQQRQRMGLYSALRQAGHTRKEATAITKTALYDWKTGFAATEATGIMKSIPFARFWTLALGQMSHAAIEPLVKPTEAMMKALKGESALARVRAQFSFFGGLHDFITPEQEDEERQSWETFREGAGHLNPMWAAHALPAYGSNRPLLGAWPSRDYWVQDWQGTRGRILTHNFMMLPPPTAIDSFSLMATWLEGMIGTAAWLMKEKRVPGYEQLALTPDWLEAPTIATTDMLFPWMRDPIQEWLLNKGHRDKAPLSPGEAAVFKMGRPLFPGLAISQNPDTGAWEMNAGAALFYRQIPFLGTQLPALVNAAWADNPEVLEAQRAFREAGEIQTALPYVKDADERAKMEQRMAALRHIEGDHLMAGIGWFFRDWGLGTRRYGYSPWDTLEQRQRAIGRGLTEAKDEIQTRPTADAGEADLLRAPVK